LKILRRTIKMMCKIKKTYKLSHRIILTCIVLGIPLLLQAFTKKISELTFGDTLSPVTLTINSGVRGVSIPEHFSGLSFETGSVRIGNAGVKGNFFDAGNSQALTLFHEMGIRGSVDANKTVPTNADIDSFLY
jgi:hypothetical protein